MRRLILLLPCFAVLALASPAFAHTGFAPDEVGPNTNVDLTLNAADERDDAIITSVELFYPEGMTFNAVVADGPGTFVATVQDASIVWDGGSADGDQAFTMSLGPMPATPERLQFKVLQTYDNGEVDRWIEDWPEGAPEPAMPGPILLVVEGGAGTPVPPTEVAPTAAPEQTTLPLVTTVAPTAAPTPPTTVPLVEASDGGAAPWLIVGAIIVVVGAGVAFFLSRRSRSA